MLILTRNGAVKLKIKNWDEYLLIPIRTQQSEGSLKFTLETCTGMTITRKRMFLEIAILSYFAAKY